MSEAQPDFTKLFSETFASGRHPIEYSIRLGPNFLHDLAFVSSLVHDARVLQSPTVVENGEIAIPINRDCWELPYTKHGNSLELQIADCQLRFAGVIAINWQFDKKPDEFPWIDYLWAEPTFRDFRTETFGFSLVGEDWKCTIALSHDDWKIELKDLEMPYLWTARNSS